jgi:hypothetical protein
MPIKMHCEHCGAAVSAPREFAGQMSKCPACGNGLYVPTPEEEIEELPLAPEDANELTKEAMLQAERRRVESLLARENRVVDGDPGEPRGSARGNAPRPASTGSIGMGQKLDQALRAYLAAMRDSDLETAQRAFVTLQMQPRTAREMIDRLIADQIPPAEMIKVPPGVYQGFLKTLRARLG